MLASLTIQNVVLIEYLTIGLNAGLCVLTGETGAGKSILLDSLGLAMGARAESRLVRKGAAQAVVTAVFDVEGLSKIEEAGIVIDPGEPIILKRIVTPDGRSRAYINDQPVSVGLLRDVGAALVEIHGQFDTQGLLNPATHRHMLDEYAAIGIETIEAFDAWKAREEELNTLQAQAEALREDEDYLRTSLEDLDALNPEPGEEKSLSETRERLRHREQALKALNTVYYDLGGDKDPVRKALKVLEPMIDKLPEGGHEIIGSLDRAHNEAEEARRLIGVLRDDLYYEDHVLEDVDERLHNLKAQARKHNCTVEDLPVKRDEIARALNAIEHQDDMLAKAVQAVTQARGDYILHAEKTSAQRREAADNLDRLIMHELPPLKLDKARFFTSCEKMDEAEWGPYGWDKIRFLVATNPGAAPGPLNKIASGGEMARFMLALKVVTAKVGRACTLVFDEVDAGVGGAVADAVGERLARLSAEGKQVMVVTHAPQIAAKADAHYIVKKDGQDIVNTNVIQLDQAQDRREEIARMLAGASITEEARAAAEKLMAG